MSLRGGLAGPVVSSQYDPPRRVNCGRRTVVSCQLSVVSCQLSVVSCQLSVVSSQRTEDERTEDRCSEASERSHNVNGER